MESGSGDDQGDLISNQPAAPAADSRVAGEGMAAIFEMVARRSLGHDGGLSLDSASLEGLRTQEGREAFLREFVVTMMPDRINPMLWVKWLQGSETPFENSRLKRPDTGTERVAKALSRSSKRIVSRIAGVERARADLEAAERALAEERAFDAAVIEYALSEHLMTIMAPMFAMGPAWVVMRALSGHVPQNEIEDELCMERDPAKRSRREEVIRRERQDESDLMMDALDYWAGDGEFEYQLREAVMNVVRGYKGQSRPDVERRTRSSMRVRVADGSLRREEAGILAGMPGGKVQPKQ